MKFYMSIVNNKIQLLTKFHNHEFAKWYFTDQKRNLGSALLNSHFSSKIFKTEYFTRNFK